MGARKNVFGRHHANLIQNALNCVREEQSLENNAKPSPGTGPKDIYTVCEETQ